MTGDPIDRLRHADPVPGGGNAAPFEEAMEWLRHRQAGPTRRRQRWRGVAPALGTATVIGVVVVVVVAISVHRRPSSATPTSAAPQAQVPSPSSLLPAHGGMRGLLLGMSLLGSGPTLRVSYVQCTNCANTTPPDAREVRWSSTSSDGGRVWRTGRERTLLLAFGINVQEGRDVWTSGFSPDATHQKFFVSHDGGRTFRPARSPTNSELATLTVGGGRVWTVGTRCVHYVCTSSALTGQAAGSRLAWTPTEPPGMPARNAQGRVSIAGYGADGYVAEGARRRLYVTDDSGRSWHRASYPCATTGLVRDLRPTAEAVWALCARQSGRHAGRTGLGTIRRSTDGGRDWQTPDPSFDTAAQIVAVSPQVAWAERMSGALERTSNGGRSWQTILSGIGAAPAVEVESATQATVVAAATTGSVAAHTRRTDFVTYRTTDGGTHWRHAVIRLPTG